MSNLTPSPKDFFISYTRRDRTWAEWIAWVLEEAGYSVVMFFCLNYDSLDFGLISPTAPRNILYEHVSRRGRFLARHFLKGLRRKPFRKCRAN